MDEFERAPKQEMDHREYSVAQARAKNQPLKFTGRCLYCNEQIEVGRYCSAECKEDGESEAAIRSRQFR